MIVTITLNPCIDKSLVIDRYTYGGLNRVESTRQDISGKGVNVAKAVKALGLSPVCTGFNFTGNGELLENELNSHGISHDFVNVIGNIRTNIKIFEKSTQTMTELNERGDFTGAEYVEKLLDKVEGMDGQIFVLSGSAPPGVEKDIYQRIIKRLRGRQVILDADGERLSLGISACPAVIKPNLYELETSFGVRLNTHGEIVRLCRKIIDQGVGMVCVSMGSEGAIMVGGNKAYFAPALPIEVKGVQGAGDSLVAGMCKAITEDVPLAEVLKYAVAAAGGSLVREGTLMCTKEGFEEMYKKVRIEEIISF